MTSMDNKPQRENERGPIVKVGDIVRVDMEYNGPQLVKVIEVLDDVSQECGLEPGPGFVGVTLKPEPYELVYPNYQLVEIISECVTQ
jgi:hypothetical protein